jgi:serine protease
VFPTRRPLRIASAIALSIGLALVGVVGTWAAPAPAWLDAPIRAFDWPVDGPPNDPYFGLQSDLAVIDVGSAWFRTTGAPAVVVAVLDTGIDAANPEFAGRLVPGFNAISGTADTPIDFGPTDDDAGHGTHVSGTIAAAANNATGIAGIAPSVSIMPVKVLGADGEGDFGGMIDGVDWAVTHGARIVTMSLGGPLQPEAVPFVQRTFDRAYAAGVVVVAASGNDGGSADQYPCNFGHVLCVGSTTSDGTAVSTFSTLTAALSLVAPGEQIASTLPGGGYGYGSGTSMATPHVTGAVALLRSLQPSLSPDDVAAYLTQTARPLVAGGRNSASGYGLLQVGAAVNRLADTVTGPTPTPTPTPGVSPSPTPDPGVASAAPPSPSTDPGIGPVPEPILIVPSVTASSPRNGTRSVTRSVRPRISFSVPMAGVSTRTVRMKDLSRERWITIRVSYSAISRTATVTPVSRLEPNHSYRIIVGRVLSANEGTPLGRPFVFTFRTGYR